MLFSDGRFKEARDVQERAVALALDILGPESPHTLGVMDNLAYLLADCPDVSLRDPKRAVELAEKVVRGRPNDGENCRTLGVAYYRDGNWSKASEALQKAAALEKDQPSCDTLFFLALARWRCGQKKEARDCYDRALPLMSQLPLADAEHSRYREEAAKLLGIDTDNTRPEKGAPPGK